ncbi:MAG: acyl-CoA dehydrogenase [Pyrinomonadaceae bacterium]
MGSQPIGEIEFTGMRVPTENRIGAEGEGFNLAMRTLDAYRASVGAAACGMARRALYEALEYAKRREQFGASISQFQLIQAKLAEMSTELDAARLLVYQAAYLSDLSNTAAPLTRAVSEAKLFATEAACRIVDSAVQIHGSQGLIRGSVVERLYRDVRALRIYAGTSEIQKLVIASQLLKE